MVSASLAGCFGEEESKTTVVEETVWDFERPELTWYHFADAIDAWGNNEYEFKDRNMPFVATGTYYGIGMSTFEPTMRRGEERIEATGRGDGCVRTL